jgi:hypothetical protein
LLAACLAQQNASNSYQVAGVVVNAATGAPLPRALVQLSGRALLSGLEGEFAFPAVPGGRNQISLSKPGFFAPGATHKGWSPPINIEVGAESGNLVLKMYPEAVISGHIAGNDKEPLEGATIQLLHFVSVNGRRQLAPVAAVARSDEDGNFRVASLPAGRYYVAVKAAYVTRRILGAETTKSNKAYPAIVYHPGVPDMEAAAPLDLAAGQYVDLQFSLATGPAFKVTGTVIATGEWKQVNPPQIVDHIGQVLFSADEFDPETGQFEFRAVPAGNYRVRLAAMDKDNQLALTLRRISVSHPLTGVKLTLNRGAEIAVVVRSEFSKTRMPTLCSSTEATGEIHNFDCSEHAARVELVSSDSPPQSYATDLGTIKEPRPLALHHVAPGRYRVSAMAMFGGYVQSVRWGSLDLLRDELIVPEDGSVGPIEVVVRDDSGMLKIHLQTQSSGQAGTVVLVPDGILSDPVVLGAAANGETQTGGLAPGAYKVFAFDSIDAVDYRNPEAMAQYASRAASVTVAPNGTANVNVELIRTGE